MIEDDTVINTTGEEEEEAASAATTNGAVGSSNHRASIDREVVDAVAREVAQNIMATAQQQEQGGRNGSNSARATTEVDRNSALANQGGMWACDVCQVYQSYDYDEVVEHEKQCKYFDVLAAAGRSDDGGDDDNGDDEVEGGTNDGFSTPTNQGVKRTRWRCDICLDATYDSFSEAVKHEQNCRGRDVADGSTKGGDDTKKMAKKIKKAKEGENNNLTEKKDKKVHTDKNEQKSSSVDVQSTHVVNVKSLQMASNANDVQSKQNQQSVTRNNNLPTKQVEVQSQVEKVEPSKTKPKATSANVPTAKIAKKIQEKCNVAQLVDSLAIKTSHMPSNTKPKSAEPKAASANQPKAKSSKKIQEKSKVAQVVDSLAIQTSQMPSTTNAITTEPKATISNLPKAKSPPKIQDKSNVAQLVDSLAAKTSQMSSTTNTITTEPKAASANLPTAKSSEKIQTKSNVAQLVDSLAIKTSHMPSKANEITTAEPKAASANLPKAKSPPQLVDSLAIKTSQMPLVKSDNVTSPKAPQSTDQKTETSSSMKSENIVKADEDVTPASMEKVIKEEQVVKRPEKKPSQSAVLSAILLLCPLIVAFLYLPNQRSTISFPSIELPSLAVMAASPIIFIAIAYSSFALALAITHQGVHHHRSQGFLLDILTALRDTVLPPKIQYIDWDDISNDSSRLTLREYLNHPDGFSMAFAPAFFGFFAYFGALTALEEETGGLIVPKVKNAKTDDGGKECGLKSVAGASAGAMAAVMLAAGIQPRVAAEYVCTFNWGMVADPPGLGGLVKGNKFADFMRSFIRESAARCGDGVGDVMLEDALVSVAVSVFDLFRMKGTILSRGCMATAARASAGFPGLFQPVSWNNEVGKNNLLIDGGIRDGLGLNGLGAFPSNLARGLRIVNMAVGDFGFNGPSGIEDLPDDIKAESLVSIAIVNTPLCGPWAMANGPRAVESARKAMASMLDTPLERGTSKNHYVLRVDASKWLE